MVTDWSKDKGCGAWDTAGNWFNIKWNKTNLTQTKLLQEIYINELEFLTLTVSLLMLMDQYKNKVIHIWCDNKATVEWLSKKAPSFTNKYHIWVSYLLRKIMLECLKNRVYIWIEYIKSKDNKRADALSRFEEPKPLEVHNLVIIRK